MLAEGVEFGKYGVLDDADARRLSDPVVPMTSKILDRLKEEFENLLYPELRGPSSALVTYGCLCLSPVTQRIDRQGSGSRGDSLKSAGTKSSNTRMSRPSAGCVCTWSSGRYARPSPARVALSLMALSSNTSCPSTRTFSSRPRPAT